MVRKNFIYCSTNSGGGSGGGDGGGDYWLPEVTIAAYSEALEPALIWGSNAGANAGGMFGPISVSGTRKYWQNMTMGGGGFAKVGGGSSIFESIINYLGYSSSVLENGMKASLLSLNGIKSLLIAKGAPTEMIDNIISRDAAIGGVARIGGQLIFYGQLGYNIYNVVNNPTLSSIALKSSDTFFSGIATYGGWPGLGIAGIYYLNRESIIITMKSLNQGLIKSNSNIMQ